MHHNLCGMRGCPPVACKGRTVTTTECDAASYENGLLDCVRVGRSPLARGGPFPLVKGSDERIGIFISKQVCCFV